MKKSLAFAGAAGIAGSLVLAACGQDMASNLLAEGLTSLGGAKVSVYNRARTVRMVVIPSFAESKFGIQALAPYHKSDINHLLIRLYRVDGALEVEQASVDLTSTQLDSPATFAGLAANSTYRVKCAAYQAPGTDPADLISDDVESTTEVVVGNDEAVSVSIRVKLWDGIFDGTGIATISIVEGQYYDSTSSPTVTVASPTPAPTIEPTTPPAT